MCMGGGKVPNTKIPNPPTPLPDDPAPFLIGDMASKKRAGQTKPSGYAALRNDLSLPYASGLFIQAPKAPGV